jgi:HK97 gp10 family phage protein
MVTARARIRITKVTNADELGRQIEPKMKNLGNAIARRMQRVVPKRTWALHDTISVQTKRSGGKVTTTVGAGGGKVNYALLVERGTSRARSQPYMRPALLQSRAADLANEGAGPKYHGTKEERSAARSLNRQRKAAKAANDG